MSWVWISGSLFYWFRYERKFSNPHKLPALGSYPKIALSAPFYNEEECAEETIQNLLYQSYPNFEVIAVNDCSRAATAKILDRLALSNPNLRVVHHAENEGKAVGIDNGCIAY